MRHSGQVRFVLLSAVISLALVVGCGDKKKEAAGGEADKAGDKGAGDEGGKGGDSGGGDKGRSGSKAFGGGGSGASAKAAASYMAWTPLHAFLGAPVVAGSVIAADQAIVFTKDNHVGITMDAGRSWGFERMTTGTVLAAAGVPGGPFVVVGPRGFLALSSDGKTWTDLPRFTDDDLWAVAAGDGIVVAVGKKGGYVKIKSDGSDAVAGTFPDKFKASAVRIDKSGIIASAGKKLYMSGDGAKNWAVTVPPPDLPGARDVATSQGLCAVGKVLKKRGVVCTLAGTAYGITDAETLVVGKAWIATSRDGGKTWAMAPVPVKGIKAVMATAGGPYHVGDGRGGVATSTDGKTWTVGTDAAVLDGAPTFKPAKCETPLPAANEACILARAITSPEGLPDVRAISFAGDVGLAMGDSALIGMTSDGGASWKTASGFALGALQGFALAGDKIVAVGKAKVGVSVDAGKGFRTVDLPAKTPALYATLIAADGSVYLAGRGGTILKADAELTGFTRLDTGPKNKTDYVYLHEVGKAIYAAGARGELHRSADGGGSWTPIASGLAEPIQKMTGEGDIVLAVSSPARYGGNKLLRSNDNGQRFFVQRELSDQGAVHDFELKGGVLLYDNLESKDFGAIWTKHAEWYWPGSVDVADGSGVRLANVNSYSGKDRFYVVGTEKDDFTIVDSFYNKGGWLRCAKSSGCWMVAGGQVYRPR